VLLRLDYSQAELRVFASYSMDEFLLGVYRDGRDLHNEVAIGMHGEDFTKEQRVMCKMFNFSYLYGGSEYSFAEDAGLNLDIARKFVQDYNRLMPQGLEYKRSQFRKLKREGYVETVFGRRRRFPFLIQRNYDDARKACVHMPCASTASDLTLLSGLKLNDEGYDVVLMIHDEVIMEVDDDPATIAQASTRMAEVMKGTAMMWIPEVPWPMTADDVEVKKRWAKPLE